MSIVSSIKSLARLAGYDVRRYTLTSSDSLRFATLLRTRGVNVVLDVGANVGQFGESLRELGYRGRIVSFEPLTLARGELVRRSAADTDWEVAPQCAVGAEEGEVLLNVAGNSVSSSVLNMLDAHSNVAPESGYVGTERVPVHTLDSLCGSLLSERSAVFLKVDTQGYEKQVLQGADEVLKRAVGCQLELSLVPLYEGQMGYLELINEMVGRGMELWDLAPVLVDQTSGRLLQVDATFVRAEIAPGGPG